VVINASAKKDFSSKTMDAANVVLSVKLANKVGPFLVRNSAFGFTL